MSRYFERLAGQVGATRVRGRSNPPTLEQHVDVEAPPSASRAESALIGSPDVAGPEGREPASHALSRQRETHLLSVAAPTPLALSRHDAKRVTREPAPYTTPFAKDISEPRSTVPSVTPEVPAPPTGGLKPITTFASRPPRTATPASGSDSAPPGTVVGEADAVGVLDVVSVPAGERDAPRHSLPRTPANVTAPAPLRAEHAQGVTRDRHSVPDLNAAPAPRVEVHVGTITMEVHAPEGKPVATAAPAPPSHTWTPTVAPAAAAAAARFSPSRYYLRWG